MKCIKICRGDFRAPRVPFPQIKQSGWWTNDPEQFPYNSTIAIILH